MFLKASKKILILSLFFVIYSNISSMDCFAANRYWVGSNTTFNSSANWSTTDGGAGGASVPGSSDIAYFTNNDSTNCEIAVGTGITLSGINITSYGGTVSLTDINDQQGTLSLSTFYLNGGTFDGNDVSRDNAANMEITSSSSSSFYINSGTFTAPAKLYLNGGWYETGGTFNHDNNNIYFVGNSDSTINVPGTESFYRLYIEKDSNSLSVSMSSGDSLNISFVTNLTKGNFNAGTGTITHNYLTITDGTYDSQTANIVLTGNLTLNDTNAEFDGADSSYVDSNSTDSSNAISMSAGKITMPTLYITGGINITGGDFIENNQDIIFDGNANSLITFNDPANQEFKNITINKGANNYYIELSSSSSSMKANGTLTLTNGEYRSDGPSLKAYGPVTWSNTMDNTSTNPGKLWLYGNTDVTIDTTGGNTWCGNINTGWDSARILSTTGGGDLNCASINVVSGTFNIGSSNLTTSGSMGVSGSSSNINAGSKTVNIGTDLELILDGTFNAQTSTVIIGERLRIFNSFGDDAGTFNAVDANSVDVNGTSSDSVTMESGELILPDTTMNIAGGWYQTGGTLTEGSSSTIIFDGGTNSMINVPTSETFRNLKISKNSGYQAIMTTGDSLIISGTTTINGGGFKASNGTITHTGAVTISTGSYQAETATIILNGQLQLTNSSSIFNASNATSVDSNYSSSQAIYITAGTITLPNNTMTVKGGWYQTGGNLVPGTGTLEFNESYSSVMQIPVTETVNNLTINQDSSSNYFYIYSGDTLNVDGTLTLTGGYLRAGSSTGILKANGSIIWNNTFSDLSTTGSGTPGNLYINTTGNVTIDTTGGNTGCENITILSDITLTTSGGAALTCDSITIEDGIFNTGTSATTISDNTTLNGGDFTTGAVAVTHGGTLTISDASSTYTGTSANSININDTTNNAVTMSAGEFILPDSTLNIKGGWNQTGGTLTEGSSGVVVFNGSLDSTINVPTSETFYSFKIDKDTGKSLTVASGDSLTINGATTIDNGIFNAGDSIITHNSVLIISTGEYQAQTASIIINQQLKLYTSTSVFNASNATTVDSNYNLPQSIYINEGTITLPNNTMTVKGGWYQIGGNLVPGTGTLTFDSNANSSIQIPTNTTFNNLTINKDSSSYYLFIYDNKTLNVNGTLTLTGGYLRANNNTSILKANGSIVWNNTFGDSNGSSPGNLHINTTGNITIDTTGGDTGCENITILSDINLTTSGGAALACDSMTVTDGSFNTGTSATTISGNTTLNGGDFTTGAVAVTHGGTLTISDTSSVYTGTSASSIDINDTTNNAVTMSAGERRRIYSSKYNYKYSRRLDTIWRNANRRKL